MLNVYQMKMRNFIPYQRALIKIKHYISLLILILVSLHANADQLVGVVVGVADGDTITLLTDLNERHKIRLLGIDAPEKNQAYGQLSKQSLSQQAFEQSVVIDWSKIDKYGRKVGKILINGTDINLNQIERGLAWHYKKYENEQSTNDRAIYSDAENLARKNQLGLWQEKAPTPPWDFRKRKM